MSSTIFLLLQFGFLGAVISAVLYCIVQSTYRAYWAPRVRKAMNTAYHAVESIRINLDGEKTNSETKSHMEWAFAKFKDARGALRRGQYKCCIELANQATDLVKAHAPRAVLKTPLRPTPPSSRIISKPDYLVWMG